VSSLSAEAVSNPLVQYFTPMNSNDDSHILLLLLPLLSWQRDLQEVVQAHTKTKEALEEAREQHQEAEKELEAFRCAGGVSCAQELKDARDAEEDNLEEDVQKRFQEWQSGVAPAVGGRGGVSYSGPALSGPPRTSGRGRARRAWASCAPGPTHTAHAALAQRALDPHAAPSASEGKRSPTYPGAAAGDPGLVSSGDGGPSHRQTQALVHRRQATGG